MKLQSYLLLLAWQAWIIQTSASWSALGSQQTISLFKAFGRGQKETIWGQIVFNLIFFIFLFWPNWTHVLADSQSAWSQIHANILGSFTIWIFTVVSGGSTPLYKPYDKGMCCPKGDGFAPFWSENWYRLCPFWSGISYGFQGNYRSGWRHCSF